MNGQTYLVYGAIFIAAILVFEGIYFMISDKRNQVNRRANKRLKLKETGLNAADALVTLQRGKIGEEAENRPKKSRFENPLVALD